MKIEYIAWNVYSPVLAILHKSSNIKSSCILHQLYSWVSCDPKEVQTGYVPYVYRSIEARSCNHCCSGKTLSIRYIFRVWVCSLSYPARKAHAPAYVACLALPYFSTLSRKRRDFPARKSYWTNCVFWFSIQPFPETFLILRRIHRHTIINIHSSSCKVPVILVSF